MIYIQDRTGETVAIVSDYYNDMHKMYTQSGTGSYDFTVSRLDKGQEFIIEGNYVVMLDDEGKAHQFTIMKVTETETEKVVECEDASLQLLNKQRRAWIKPATAQPIAYYANKALQGTGWEIGYNEVPNLNRTLEWAGSDSSLNRLFSIATQFDNAELDFHVELDRTRVIKRVVDIKKKLGSERDDIQLVYGDTVTGIQKTVSILNFRTALYGVGALVENTKENEPEKHYDFSAIEYDDGDFFSPKGDPMLYARKANERFNLGKEYIDEDYSFDTKDANELLKHTLTHLKEVSEPEINYEVELADFDGLHLTRGDTVRIIDHGYNPELLITARVIELDKSYTDPSQDKAIFGNFMSLVSGIDPMLLKIQQQLRQLPKARTPYPWVRYADDDKGTGMSALPAGKSYMATVWNYETAVPSDNPIDYAEKWVLIKGADGVAGKDGVSVESTVVTYQLGTSGTTKPTSTWSSTVPTLVKGQYLWTKTTWNYSDRTSEDGYQVTYIGKDGNNGSDGLAGKDGVGISSTLIEYVGAISGTSEPTSGWSTTIPAVPAGQYLWTRTTWQYTDGTSEQGFTNALMGRTGADGKDGVDGKDGEPGSKDVPVITSGTSFPAGSKNGDQHWMTNSSGDVIGFYKFNGSSWIASNIDAKALNVTSLSALTANLGTINAGTLNGVKLSAPDIVSEFNGVVVKPTIDGSGITATGDIRLKDGKIELQGKIDGTTQKFYSGMTYKGLDSYITASDGSTPMHSASLMYGELALDDLVTGSGNTAQYLITAINAESLYLNSTSSINWLSGWSNFAGTPTIFRFGGMVAISGYIQTSGSNLGIMRVPDWAKPASTSYGTGTAFEVSGLNYPFVSASYVINTNGIVSVNRPGLPNGHGTIVLVYKGARLI